MAIADWFDSHVSPRNKDPPRLAACSFSRTSSPFPFLSPPRPHTVHSPYTHLHRKPLLCVATCHSGCCSRAATRRLKAHARTHSENASERASERASKKSKKKRGRERDSRTLQLAAVRIGLPPASTSPQTHTGHATGEGLGRGGRQRKGRRGCTTYRERGLSLKRESK